MRTPVHDEEPERVCRRRVSRLVHTAVALACLLLFPAVASAQGGIAGLVKDASGGVLPGVTVEASSPELIEKTRTAVTDAQGRYSFVDLRPGTYAVAFTLPGFNAVRREGVAVTVTSTATVNAEMGVGTLEETLTVTGDAPLVDVQRTTTQTVMSKELLDAVPNIRAVQRYTAFIPGVQTSGAAALASGLGREMGNLAIHGGRLGEANTLIEGVATRHLNGTGGSPRFQINQAMVQEVAVSLGSAGADQQMGGIMQNIVPRQGGNNFSGLVYFHFTNDKFTGNNLSDELEALGLGGSGAVRESWDINPGFGGPIFRDKLWFFAAYRHWGNDIDSGSRYNLTPQEWVYTPDLTRPTASYRFSDRNYTARFTWQAAERHQFSVFYDNNPRTWYNRSASPTVSPEASTYTPYYPNYITQAAWKSPVTSRLFLEATGMYANSNNNMFPTGDPEIFRGAQPADPAHLIGAQELTTGLQFRSTWANQSFGDLGHAWVYRAAAAASYVTGSHTLKVGTDYYSGHREARQYRNGDIRYQLRNGRPSQLTMFGPSFIVSDLKADFGLYIQDRWTFDRLTTNLGVRYDYLNSSVPAGTIEGNRWMGPRTYDAVEGVPVWHDISPRMGLSYDLFGNGKTAIKASLNRYVEGVALDIANANSPVVTSVLSANRNWNDQNGNFEPDCDFSNLDANGECGSISDRNFGRNNPRATRWDQDLLTGYGDRGFNWETAVQLQHQLLDGLSVNAGYHRRSYGNFQVTKNTALGDDPSVHYDPFCVTLPADARLPGAGEQLCGFYDIKPNMRGVVENLVTFESTFGERKEVYNGFDLILTARFPNGAQISGGSSTGRTALDSCFVVNSPQEELFCDVRPPMQTQVKFMGVYPLPWWGIQVSGSFQSVPGPEILANYEVPSSEIAGSLGRPLSAGATATVNLPIVQPGTIYSPRWQQTDMRVSKTFRLANLRMLGSLDVFNLFNSAGVVQVNQTYGPAWQRTQLVLNPRQFRLSAQVDF
jgi:hypothetical protein